MRSQTRSGMALFAGICLAAVAAGNLLVFWILAQDMGRDIARPTSPAAGPAVAGQEATIPRRPLVLPIAPAEVTGVVRTDDSLRQLALAQVPAPTAPESTLPGGGVAGEPSPGGEGGLDGRLVVEPGQEPVGPATTSEQPADGSDETKAKRGLGHCKDTHHPRGHRDDHGSCLDVKAGKRGHTDKRGDHGKGKGKDKLKRGDHRKGKDKLKRGDDGKGKDKLRSRGRQGPGVKPPIFASIHPSDGESPDPTPEDVPVKSPAHPVFSDLKSPPGLAKGALEHRGKPHGKGLGHGK